MKDENFDTDFEVIGGSSEVTSHNSPKILHVEKSCIHLSWKIISGQVGRD